MVELIEDEWYWVRTKSGGEWFPAMHRKDSVGGWTNGDTWEDFKGRVIEYIRIPKPEEIIK